MIRILLDSSADFTAEEAKERNLELVSINITLNGKNYRDGIDITKDEFYEMLVQSEEFPMTAQPSPQDFLDVFEDAKEKGDSIVYLSLSSGLSGTFQSATLAKSMVEYDEIYLVDTLSATRAIRIMAEYACKMREEGKDAASIAAELENFKSRVVIYAAIDTLEYLQKGGRLSKTSATIGNIVNIKPIVTISEEGTVSIVKKCVGKVKARSGLISLIKENNIDSNYPIYPVYSYGTTNCDKMMEVLEKEEVKLNERLQIGASIGSHVGPECYGVVFVKEK
jgi:DegV family protein with EDD domain